MLILLKIVHVIVCLFLIAVVLLQSGKGAEMGASFGSGGSQSVFGAGGGTTFLSKMTTAAAIIFMLTSLWLAYISGAPSPSIMADKNKPVAVGKPPLKSSSPTGSVPVTGKPAVVPAVPAQPKK